MNAIASAVAAATGSTTTTAPPTGNKVASDPLANEETFLKLLVSQLKNQDPLNPPDTSQFVSQLTAYSQLEQLIGIRENTTSSTAPGTDAATAADQSATASLIKTHRAG